MHQVNSHPGIWQQIFSDKSGGVAVDKDGKNIFPQIVDRKIETIESFIVAQIQP